jgi:hypothetical protein
MALVANNPWLAPFNQNEAVVLLSFSVFFCPISERAAALARPQLCLELGCFDLVIADVKAPYFHEASAFEEPSRARQRRECCYWGLIFKRSAQKGFHCGCEPFEFCFLGFGHCRPLSGLMLPSACFAGCPAGQGRWLELL